LGHIVASMEIRPLRTAAFTLVEILVVMGIIAALSALIFPTYSKARAAAKQAVCVNQLRQIGLAMRMYVNDNGHLAPRLSALHPTHLSNAAVFVCPADPGEGQQGGDEYLEGSLHLASGVSYTYMPNWKYSAELGWWGRPPRYGEGRFGDLTPLAACHWHWAKEWLADFDAPVWAVGDPRGWVFVLTAGGSVRKVRAEAPLSEYSPTGG